MDRPQPDFDQLIARVGDPLNHPGVNGNQSSLQSCNKCTLLVVDDDRAILNLLSEQLGQDFRVIQSVSSEQAKQILTEQPIDIILTDLLLTDSTGIQLLDWVHRVVPQTARVLLTGTARIEDAADAINCCRIHRLILKPWRKEDLLTALKSVARNLLLERSHERLVEELQLSHHKLEQRVRDRTKDLELALLQLQSKNQILENMALTDALTSLPNRRAIELIARKELTRRGRSGGPIAFGLIDADHFKRINDLYLLNGGDYVLAWLAGILQKAIRITDAMGRVGGEEFMVVAPETDLAGARILAERLRASVAQQTAHYQGHDIVMTVSIGFAVLPADVHLPYEHFREQAAIALAQAKTQGRNCSVVRECECLCSHTLHIELPAETVSDD